ncbi:SGNH/GDSL hydrolase family protein [Spongisporangium articulatum]|uniref:SGNH/GDSL hydrolase family protein n=1 Tax=Spongisporangium articulatum TaxID=3362603 RepID=A0ABW8ATZ6_9ACTN
MALGDSFTEGLEDVWGPDGRHRGWADRVALALATRQGRIEYANLAVRGRLLDQVVTDQVPAALSLRPALVSFHAGANDLLRPRVDVGSVVSRYRRVVEDLAGAGARVVLFTVIEGSGGSGRTAAALAERFGTFNAAARSVAAATGAVVVDVGRHASLRDRRLWHEDRLHLNADGHARVATAVLEALGADDPALLGGPLGWWSQALPTAAPVSRLRSVRDDVRWVRRHLLPWVGRRLRGVSSGDAVTPKHPHLVTITPDDAPAP